MSYYRYAYACRRGEGCTVWLVSTLTGDRKDVVASGVSRRKAQSLTRQYNTKNEGLGRGRRKRRR